MYTEDYEEKDKRKFPIKDFLLKLILIIIFVLLLMWLIPWTNNKSLTDRIFNENINDMKYASILYFTKDRLPANVGDKKTLTLQEMLDLKLLLPFTDKNGKSCDSNKSYVTIEKLESEYLLKVYLSCDDQKDYVLVHVGCYAYCTTDICEKKNDTNPPIKPTPTNKPIKPTPTNKPIKPTPTPTNKPIKPTPTPPPIPGVEYTYQYKKHVEDTYSAWTGWSKPIVYVDADNIKFGNYSTIEALHLETKYQVVGYRPITITYKISKPVQVGSYEQKFCTGYSYTKVDSVEYQVVKDWYDTGKYYSDDTAPNNSLERQYVFVGIDWDVCKETCTSHPILRFKEQARSVKRVTNTISIGGLTCTSVDTRTIPLYATQVTTETKTTKQDVFGYVKYYHYRTRKLLEKEHDEEIWSDSLNDQSLITKGFIYTGIYKVKG